MSDLTPGCTRAASRSVKPEHSDAVVLSPAQANPASRFDAVMRSHHGIAVMWLVIAFVIAGWSAWHLGATHLTATVTVDGRQQTVPDTFASVDHPYHTVRAQLLIDSLRHGHLLRWVGQHEGGYPAEFYPLGMAWLAAALWTISLGTLSVISAYKLVVIGTFLAPLLGFVAMARLGKYSAGVGVLAFVAHLAVPGEWWSGGYTELIGWGLITNVGAYLAAFGFLAALFAFVRRPSRWPLVAGVALSSFAVATNTRSIIALGCAAIGVLLSLAIEPDIDRNRLGLIVARIVTIGVLAALLSAPLLLASLRYSYLYTFIRYKWYDDVASYWHSSVAAVSWPVMALAVVGFGLAFALPGRTLARAVALTLIAYVAATVVLGGMTPAGGLIAQLEATRMMPFQRLLVITLAAIAVGEILLVVATQFRSTRVPSVGLAVVSVAVFGILVMSSPAGLAPEDRSMYPVETTANGSYESALAAIRLADQRATPNTALFITGSAVGWHQPLWAPDVTDRPLVYDNWLWLWQDWNRAPQIAYEGQAIANRSLNPNGALGQSYLTARGVGAVVTLTPALTEVAAESPALERVGGSDGMGVFVVRQPGGFISGSGMTAANVSFSDERIQTTVSGIGGPLTIRETWFPRWRATVNGRPVPVQRDDRGGMTIEVPPGTSRIELRYAVNQVDWLGRILSAAAVIMIALLVLWPRAWHVLLRIVRPSRSDEPSGQRRDPASLG